MPDVNLTQLRQWQRDVAKRSGEREKITLTVAKRSAQLGALDAEIAQLALAGDAGGLEEKRAARERLATSRQGDFERLAQFDEDLREVIGRGHALIDSGDADASVPLMLLPLRLETRFTPDGRALRVRIFPDDIHLDTLDRGVSERETAAAVAYWNGVWRASDEDAATAWRILLESVGRRRASWVGSVLRPKNLASRLSDPAPIFDPAPPRSKSAAVARLLPDAFTAVAIQGTLRNSATGHAVLPEVTVGLYSNDGSELHTVQGVKVAAGAEWLVDYAEAERVGMAVTVPLRSPGAKVDRLLVYGVRRSLDPKNAPAQLADLLQAHRCAQGLAFLPQGTPTNNTETDRAGWQRRLEPYRPARDANTPDGSSNAAVLAAALGLDVQALANLDHSDEQEQSRARAMNVALWGPSWGAFLEKANRVTKDGATLSDATREDIRSFHRDHVRGRGPLPALRVGSQPYGILPVSVASRWRSDRGDRFETALLPMLARLRDKWRQCLTNVPRVGEGPIDEALLEMLGSSPVCLALRVRTVLSEEIAQLGSQISGIADTELEIERMIDEMIFEEVIANASLVRRTGSLAAESRPLGLPLVHEGDPAFIDALLADAARKTESVLQALLELAWDLARRDVDKDSAGGRLPEIVRNATTLSAADRERTLAVATRAQSTPATTFFAEAKRLEANLTTAVPTHTEFQPLAAVRRSFGELALESTAAESRAQLGLYGTHAWLYSQGRLNELREALIELKATGLDERRILIAETLDLASHRLDGWITGIVDRRRRAQREASPTNLSIGAYGWVEDIVPTGNRALDGGFIHAPNMSHAATAGVLRSAYLSHNADGSGNGAFAIDLSSSRVRSALHLVDGVRQGQPLGGLLGYRIERRLHEDTLDRFILSLRKIAPLTQGKLTDRGETVAPGALEALAAGNVVDGIELIEKYQGKVTGWDANRIRKALDERPADNPYLTGDWPLLTDAEWAKMAANIADAAAALDATGDLLLAESVHQLVSGSTARASAALDAASGGDAPPPEPGFVATPAEGMPFTHRIMAIAGDASPWNVTRPRSAAEPRLEAWAAARLGNPATIVIADAPDGTLITVGDSGQCALDLVYDAADRAAFAQRLRAALPVLASDAPFHDTRHDDWAPGLRAIGDVFENAASLRALLVKARPATPMDLTLPNAPTTRSVGNAELQAAHDRAQAARDLLALRCTMVEALLGVILAAIREKVATEPLQLRPLLEDLAAFGLVPPLVRDDQLPTIAQATLASGQRRVKNADAALARPLTVDTVAEAGQAIFGDGFWITPAIGAPVDPDGWTAALATPPPGVSATAIRTLLTDYAAVRDGARRYVEATLLTNAPAPRVAQLAGPGKIPPTRWIGGPFALDEPTPDTPVVSAVLDIAGNYDGAGSTVALVLEDWVEVVPIRARRGEGAGAPVDERVATGVAFNAMAPSARAPQAILLAISPDGARWTGETIVETLEETLELARLRAVTLERTNGIARILPALYEQSWSLQGEKVLDLRAITQQAAAFKNVAAYVKE